MYVCPYAHACLYMPTQGSEVNIRYLLLSLYLISWDRVSHGTPESTNWLYWLASGSYSFSCLPGPHIWLYTWELEI